MTKKTRNVLVQALTYCRLPMMNLWMLIVLACLAIWGTMPVFWFWFTLILMIAVAWTDSVDGYLARRFELTSRLGAYGDPFMDHVYYACALPVLILLACIKHEIGHALVLTLLTVLYLQRDHLTTTLRALGSLHQADVRAGWSGKARTIFSFPLIGIVYSYLCAPETAWLIRFPFWLVISLEIIGILLNFYSATDYTRRFWPFVSREIDSLS